MLNKKTNIYCPNQNCYLEISYLNILKLVSSNDILKQFENNYLEEVKKNAQEDVFNCLTPGCGYFFFGDKEVIGEFVCPKCKIAYCLKCNDKFHFNQACIDKIK